MKKDKMKTLCGALLIGGKSRRMGFDKSLIPRGETTLGHYLCLLLEEVTGTPPVLLGRGSIGGADSRYERVEDRLAGAGPLSALLGLFDRFPDTSFLVLATDLYAMNSTALVWLMGRAGQSKAPAIWPRFPERPFGEPLAACYRPAARESLENHWHQGGRGLHRALADHAWQPEIPAQHRTAFRNANDPNMLRDLSKRVGSQE